MQIHEVLVHPVNYEFMLDLSRILKFDGQFILDEVKTCSCRQTFFFSPSRVFEEQKCNCGWVCKPHVSWSCARLSGEPVVIDSELWLSQTGPDSYL